MKVFDLASLSSANETADGQHLHPIKSHPAQYTRHIYDPEAQCWSPFFRSSNCSGLKDSRHNTAGTKIHLVAPACRASSPGWPTCTIGEPNCIAVKLIHSNFGFIAKALRISSQNLIAVEQIVMKLRERLVLMHTAEDEPWTNFTIRRRGQLLRLSTNVLESLLRVAVADTLISWGQFYGIVTWSDCFRACCRFWELTREKAGCILIRSWVRKRNQVYYLACASPWQDKRTELRLYVPATTLRPQHTIWSQHSNIYSLSTSWDMTEYSQTVVDTSVFSGNIDWGWICRRKVELFSQNRRKQC